MNKENYTGVIKSSGSDTREFDFIIVGQGLCGTLLSWYLLKAGQKVLVVDSSRPFSASRVASGVINPVTGRRIVRTWRIEELLPFAKVAYTHIGEDLNADIICQKNIIDFFPSPQMHEAFEKRLPDENEYLGIPQNPDAWRKYFNYHFGVGEIRPCLLVDLVTLLNRWRSKLAHDGNLQEENFNWQNCRIKSGFAEYKNSTAKKIVFCEGVEAFDNPYFKNLPWSRMKGEALIVSIPGLPRTNIYKQGVNIVPWKEDLFWIGSTYEWDFRDVLPTPAWRAKVEEHLKYWLKTPFNVIDHIASERPANMERRPFAGLHPAHPSIGILNGMGAKGCSIAPFFAKQLCDHLIDGSPIYADADVKRFEKVLART